MKLRKLPTLEQLNINGWHLDAETAVMDCPEISKLRAQMNLCLKKHFKGKSPASVMNSPIPANAVAIFNKVCDIVERKCPGYIASRL